MNKEAERYLKLFLKRDKLSMAQVALILNTDLESCSKPIAWLHEQGFLDIDYMYSTQHGDSLTVETPLGISFDGSVALEEHWSQIKYRKYNEIRAWITFAIAVASFIKAFFFI